MVIRNYRIIAVDFDGTLVEENWPLIGKPIAKNIDIVRKLGAVGHKLILNTCREGALLDEAVEFCRKNGITFNAINKNLPELIKKYGSDPRKISADFYFDDRSVTIQQLERVLFSFNMHEKDFKEYVMNGRY